MLATDLVPGASQDDPIILVDNDDDDLGQHENEIDVEFSRNDGEATPIDCRRIQSGGDFLKEKRSDAEDQANYTLGEVETDTAITKDGQAPNILLADSYAAPKILILPTVGLFSEYERRGLPLIPPPPASALHNTEISDYVRCLSKDQQCQYAPFLPTMLGSHAGRQQQNLLEPPRGEVSGGNEPQCVTSTVTNHSLSAMAILATEVMQSSNTPDEHASSTVPAIPCIYKGGSSNCGAREHNLLTTCNCMSNNLPAEQLHASSEHSHHAKSLEITRQRASEAQEASPLPDEIPYLAVDNSAIWSVSSRKRCLSPSEDRQRSPPKRSCRRTKMTWKLKEAQKLAAVFKMLD